MRQKLSYEHDKLIASEAPMNRQAFTIPGYRIKSLHVPSPKEVTAGFPSGEDEGDYVCFYKSFSRIVITIM